MFHRTLSWLRFYNSNNCLKLISSYSTVMQIHSNIIKKGTGNFMIPLLCPGYNNKNIRYKNTKKDKQEDDTDSDEDSDEELEMWQKQEPALNKISKVAKFSTTSLRLDGIIKSGLNISRNKIDVWFYESRLRLNGEKVLKKSVRVKEEDEIDVIKSVNSSNPDHLNISRIEVLQITGKDESIDVIYRRYKSLTIENYDDPWKPTTETEKST